MSPGELRVVGVGQTLGDDALKVRINRGSVKRAPVADNAVGKRNPTLGPFAVAANAALRCFRGGGRKSSPSGRSKDT